MSSPAKIKFLAILAIVLISLSGSIAFGQGKGHKGGGKGGHGGGHPQKGGPPPNAGQPRMSRPQPQMQRPQRHKQRPQPQMQRAQPRFQRPQPPQRQQRQIMPGWQMGKGHGRDKQRVQQPRPQPQFDARRMQRSQPPKPRHEVRARSQPQFDPGRWQVKGKKHERKGYPAPGLLGPPVKNRAWPENYGHRRSAEVHDRNAERKALKEQAKRSRRYEKRYYTPSRVDVRRFDEWRDDILRSVVSSAITVNTGPSYYSTPYYGNDHSYSAPYYPPAYSSGYYPVYQQYPAYTETVTYYDFYDPDHLYSSYGYSDYSDYSDHYSDDIGLPSYYAEDLGLPLLSDSSMGGIIGRLFSELIAFGYDQGYQDALDARAVGQRDRFYYEDPYDPYILVDHEVVEDIGYNPYSCIADDRRYVSQGYELGYRDALYGTSDYDPYYDAGNIDLVSALIGASL